MAGVTGADRPSEGRGAAPAIAIFPWGGVIEEFLDPIGMDVDGLVGRMSGGWLFGYVASLQSIGWRPLIVCASRNFSSATRLVHEATGALVWVVPGAHVTGGWNSWQTLRRWWATPIRDYEAVIEAEGCSALLVQEYEDPKFDLLVRSGNKLGIPVFATFQGGNLTLTAIERVVRARSIAKSAGLLIASEAEQQRVRAAYGARLPTIHGIPNPIDTDEWKPFPRGEARAALGLSEDEFIAVSHGRIDFARKGQDVLASAWLRGASGRLVIIGSGQDDQRLERLLSSSECSRIEWQRGYTNDRDLMRRWLSAADIFVTASRLEGMPVAPLEAIACGLPVVASDAQGLPEIVGTGAEAVGRIVPKEDSQALADAVNELAGDPALRRALGVAARRRAETRFSITAVGSALAQVLRPWAPR